MPELPEVETIKRVLEPQISGLQIGSVDVDRPEVIAHPMAAAFCRMVAGQVIGGMGRRGKFLQIRLESGDTVVLHLRMTGSLLLTPSNYPAEKHTHATFHLSGGHDLRFIDTRRFGRFWLIHAGEDDTYSGAGKLGPEPFDASLSVEYLRASLGRRRRPIKDCLLDQSVVAGVGNIYSDEILFTAKVRPGRPACSLTDREWQRLADAIPERLAYFVEKNVITPEEYLAGKGQDYRNTPFLQVYGRAGKPCPTCGKTLCRIVVAGRSSVFCPRCQKGPIPEKSN